MRRSTGLATLVVAAVVMAGVGSAAAHPHPGFYGVYYQLQNQKAKDVRRMAKGHVANARLSLSWPRIESRQGVFDWSSSDELIGKMASKGIRVLPTLFASPRWVATPSTRPPIDSEQARAAWQDFVTHAVDRYGPGGDFWSANGPFEKAHSGKAPIPVNAWQIWNEPNLSHYFSPKPSPKEYAKLLDISNQAIKNADPKAKVVFAGMPANAIYGVNSWDYYRKILKIPGVKNDFDVAAVHPYAVLVSRMQKWIKKTHNALQDGGAGSKPLWITEIGWGSAHPDKYGFNKGIDGQKAILKDALKKLYKIRHRYHIKKAFWYDLRDPSGDNRTCSFCGSAGLFTHGGDPKPSWKAFKTFTGG